MFLCVLFTRFRFFFRNSIVSFGLDVQFTVLGHEKAPDIVLLLVYLELGYHIGSVSVLHVQDEELAEVEKLHLVQQVFLQVFTVLFDHFKVVGCDGLKFK